MGKRQTDKGLIKVAKAIVRAGNRELEIDPQRLFDEYCRTREQIGNTGQLQTRDLEIELETVRKEITEAKRKDQLFGESLVKALLATRLEILETTEALLQQRILANKSGMQITVEVRVAKPDLSKADRLEREIKTQEAELAKAQQEANMYSGGLVQAMLLTTVATHEQTLAMLRQEYLVAKYGLGMPELAPPKTETGIDATREGTKSIASARDGIEEPQIFEIVGIDTRVTESNPTWSKFAWKLTVKNLSSKSICFDATIEFLDSAGFVVDDDRERDLILAPYEENTFTGYDLIDADIAHNVASISAKVTMTR